MAKNSGLVCFFLVCLIVGFTAEAGEIREEFDSPELDPGIWKITTSGKASFKIEKGKLILTSDGVEDGIFLYYVRKIGNEDIVFEAVLDPSEIRDAGAIGFTKEILTPDINTKINERWLATFMGVKPSGCYLFDENLSAHLDMKADYNPGQHVFRTEIAGDKITFSVDQKKIGELKREAPERYYMISPDPYTSHYAGGMSIDSIRVTGANVVVKPESRLAVTWGSIKSQY